MTGTRFGQHIVAVDGHDGSGKTTLALGLARRLQGVYARPFSGQTGKSFIEAAEGGGHEKAIEIAQTAVAKTVAREGHAKFIVLDRCWITVFSAIPDEYFNRWQDRVPTLLCWSDLTPTLDRLNRRAEPQASVHWHAHYIRRYADLAHKFECPIVRTDQLGERAALDRADAWVRSMVD